jgi:hypothetical protein
MHDFTIQGAVPDCDTSTTCAMAHSDRDLDLKYSNEPITLDP